MLVQKIFGIMRKDVCEKNISTFPKKLLASKAENFVRAYKMVVDVAPHAPQPGAAPLVRKSPRPVHY